MLVFSDTLRSLSTSSPFKALEAMCKKLEKYSINKEDIYKNVLDNIENFDIMTAKRFVNLLTFSSKSIYIQ